MIFFFIEKNSKEERKKMKLKFASFPWQLVFFKQAHILVLFELLIRLIICTYLELKLECEYTNIWFYLKLI
jgi:hypothetical protein